MLFEVLAALKPAIGIERVWVRKDGGVEVDEGVPRGYHSLRVNQTISRVLPFDTILILAPAGTA